MQKIALFVFIVFTWWSCSDKKGDSSGVWIGGQIINPSSNTVIISQGNVFTDTLHLDDNNRFLKHYETLPEGIYTIVHDEFQILYLSPGDSLMVRINTIEFDESIGFTGIGADRNRFLIDMFLLGEKENKNLPQYYLLASDDFVQKMDSMYDNRVAQLQRFSEKTNLSKNFVEVAQASINYDYYTKLEMYPYAHYGRNNVTLADLPENYYDFRQKIDYNSEALQNFYTYFSFLAIHFDNLAFEKYCKEMNYDDESLIHITKKIEQIDQLVSLEYLRNQLLYNSIRRYIVRADFLKENNDALDLYYRNTTNEQNKQEVENLYQASLKLLPGNTLPDISLENTEGKALNLNSVLKRNTVLSFWSLSHPQHYLNCKTKLNELRKKYPEFDFLAININENSSVWMETLSRNQMTNSPFDFRFQQPERSLDELVIRALSKVFIVNKDGIIYENNTNLFQINFEEQLLGIINK